MDNYKFYFQQFDINKASVCFTWDDNFSRHKEIIAPLFLQNKKRCTFYVNIGDTNFSQSILGYYLQLQNQGFEIGSHGYNHIHMSQLNEYDFLKQLKESIRGMEYVLKRRPTTFAFPHHDYNENMLLLTKRFFLETRNTLSNSIRISLKSNTKSSDIFNKITETVFHKCNIVFSGHSIKTEEDEEKNYIDGYEPIDIKNLKEILDFLDTNKYNLDVITFEQAALKEYIKKKCNYTNIYYTLNDTNLDELLSFGFNMDTILSLS